MLKVLRSILAGVLAFLGVSRVVDASGFMWRPETISFSIKRDDQYLMVGQYLMLENELREGESGWTMSRMELPEEWVVESLEFEDGSLVLKIQSGERFELRPPQINQLDFEILDGGRKSEQELQRLWRRHVGPKG